MCDETCALAVSSACRQNKHGLGAGERGSMGAEGSKVRLEARGSKIKKGGMNCGSMLVGGEALWGAAADV